jgi:hypothetical protein
VVQNGSVNTKGLRIGSDVSNDDFVRKLGLANQGGIRFRGKAEAPDDVVAIITTSRDAVYRDELSGPNLRYRGEGQARHQRATRGNRALISCWLASRPIRVFRQRASDRYEFLGTFQITGLSTGLERDRDKDERAVFVFELKRIVRVASFWPA